MGRQLQDARDLLAIVEELFAERRGAMTAFARLYAEAFDLSEVGFRKRLNEFRKSGKMTHRERERWEQILEVYTPPEDALRGKRAAAKARGEAEPRPEPLDFDAAFAADELPGPLVDEQWIIVRPDSVPPPDNPGKWHCFACGEVVKRDFGAKIVAWQWLHLCERCFSYPVLPPPVIQLNLWHATRGRWGTHYTADEIDTWIDGLAESLKNGTHTPTRGRRDAPPADMPTTEHELEAFDRALDARLDAYERGELDLATAPPLDWRAFLGGAHLNGNSPVRRP